jgi:hypothetical protein
MSDQHELEERVKTAQAECERLREENVRLRAMLSIHDQFSNTQALRPRLYLAAASPRPLHLSQKIALFRGLFRGREDVYAVRWEGKGGKAGYSRLASWTGRPFTQLDTRTC